MLKKLPFKITFPGPPEKSFTCLEDDEKAAREQGVVHFRLQNISGAKKKLIVERIKSIL